MTQPEPALLPHPHPHPSQRPLARRTAPAGLIVAATAALLAACSPPPAPQEPVRAVRTMVVAPEAAGGQHEFAGEVKPRIESRLGFRVGGKLLRRTVNLGDAVKAGQVLAQLDPQDQRLGQEAAQAALRSAQANFDLVQAEFKRYKELREQNFISGLELERRETALKAAQATLEQAKVQVSAQGNQAAYTTLMADAAGVVTGVDAEPGMVLAAGTPVLRVAQDGPRDVVFSVPEDQVAAVRALQGKPAALQVRLWESTDKPLAATVREVAAAADAATRTFAVKADVGPAAPRLGQTATVVMSLPVREGVIKLPLAAVAQSQGQTVVWLLDKAQMTVKPQPVQVAGAEGNTVVLAGGVKPGDTVVTAGVHVLTPGQKVKLYVERVASAPVAR